MRKIIFLLFLSISNIVYSQEYLNFKDCKTENDFNNYFQKNILSLDPLEGIYIINSGYIQSAQGYGENRILEECNIAIVKDNDGNFYEYQLDDEEWCGRDMFFKNSGGDSYYFIDKKLDVKQKFLFNGFKFNCSYEMNLSQKKRIFTGISNFVKVICVHEAIKTFPSVEMYNQALAMQKQRKNASSGTGFFLSNNGYIITNYHVIEDAENNNIKVTGISGDYNNSYTVKVAVSDKQNDITILKIEDNSFIPIKSIPYTFKFDTSSIGEDCFVLGYPLISSMGKDIKLTSGIISSKTGYDGNVSQYQISAPIQPGNSGGPLFDKNGNIIGIIQAKHSFAENAGYAIKASYIRNLIDLLPTSITLPQYNLLKGKTLPQQVELASKAVCIIIVNGD